MGTDIVLINPRIFAKGVNKAVIEVPLGILYIASFLERHGFKCTILDANAMNLSDESVLTRIDGIRPLVVGISANAFNFQAALSYSKKIKQKLPDSVIILGGPQPSVVPQITLENDSVDAVVYGEGEETTYEIVKNVKASNRFFEEVQGVAYRDNNRIVVNPPATRIDIETLPFPAYHLLPDLGYYRSRSRKWPFMGIITSRGCPYSCSFCSKTVFGNKVTLESPQKVVSEITFLTRKMHIRQIDILDDNFTFDIGRCVKICELIISKSLNVSINLQCGVRAENINKELISLFRKAGVFKIAFGVESGAESISKSVEKHLNYGAILNAARLAKKSGMVVAGLFMIGLPYETPYTLQKTVDFAKKMDPHFANFTITIPFYGTPLYELIKQKGKLLIDTKEGITSGFFGGQVFFEFGDLTKEVVLHFYKKAYRDFYFRISKIIDILGAIRSWRELRWLLNASFDIFSNKGVF